MDIDYPNKTKFKPKDVSDEYLRFGVYFKSENDISADYLIQFNEGSFNHSAITKIYLSDIPSNHFEAEGLVNGDTIGIPDYETELVCEINLFCKYYILNFKKEMQLYYDEEKYYGGQQKTDSVASLMECVNRAIEYGLNKSGIKPY